jgi:hypothetical protein
MISLNLRTEHRAPEQRPRLHRSFEEIEHDLYGAVNELATKIEEARRSTLLIPTDVLFHAHATLFPAERMSVLASRRLGGRTVLGAAYDVTGQGPDANRVHVRASQSARSPCERLSASYA